MVRHRPESTDVAPDDEPWTKDQLVKLITAVTILGFVFGVVFGGLVTWIVLTWVWNGGQAW